MLVRNGVKSAIIYMSPAEHISCRTQLTNNHWWISYNARPVSSFDRKK